MPNGQYHRLFLKLFTVPARSPVDLHCYPAGMVPSDLGLDGFQSQHCN
jgi:hypothetical protein